MSNSFRLLLLRRRFFARFELADSLRHRSHRAEGAPRARHIGRHDDYAEERRRQHEAVEPESKLRDPIRRGTGRERPVPGNSNRPEERNRLAERVRAGRDLNRLPDH